MSAHFTTENFKRGSDTFNRSVKLIKWTISTVMGMMVKLNHSLPDRQEVFTCWIIGDPEHLVDGANAYGVSFNYLMGGYGYGEVSVSLIIFDQESDVKRIPWNTVRLTLHDGHIPPELIIEFSRELGNLLHKLVEIFPHLKQETDFLCKLGEEIGHSTSPEEEHS